MVDEDNLHHAYLVPGDEDADALLASIFSQLGIKESGNPDFFAFRTDSFGIDEARDLGARAGRKAFGHRKIFVISAGRITVEAQNALLKSMEDPYPDTHFFVRVRGEHLLIPTLRSRMQVLRPGGSVVSNTEEAEKFLASPISDRLNFAKKFADDERAVSPFLDAVMKVLKAKQSSLDKLDRVFTLRRFADDRSASARLLLEHLSLVI
jgi:hypothetical protein